MLTKRVGVCESNRERVQGSVVVFSTTLEDGGRLDHHERATAERIRRSGLMLAFGTVHPHPADNRIKARDHCCSGD
jgi:hypothetical protein